MKRAMYAVLGSVVILISSAFAERAIDKKYRMELTQQQWQSRLGVIEFTINAVKNSDIPIKTANPIIDSLASFEQDIVTQIRPQLIDSTGKK